MYLLVAVRYHLVPVARRILKRTSAFTFAAYIPIAMLTGYGYWRYGVAVQQLPDLPLSLPMARLGTLLGLVPILFIRTPVTRGASIFHSMATEEPTMALKIMILRNLGSRCAYVLLLVLGAAPFVVRLSDSLEQSILHLVSDGVYVVIYCAAVTLIDCASTGRPRYRIALLLCVLSLVGIETLLLFYRPWADVVSVALNVTVVGVCWTRYIPRMKPVLIQEYFNGLVAITDRKRRRLRGILDAVGVETKVYLKSFLLTANSVIPIVAALAVYVGLVVFLIRGTQQDEPLSSVMVLGFGASFFYSNILIENFRNFNLMFIKMSPVTFFRLTRSILTPHCIIVGLSTAVIVVLLTLLGMAQWTPALLLISYVVFLPTLSWSVAMRFLNSRILGGLYNAVLALGGLVLSVVAPAVYVLYAVVTGVFMYRRGMRRYAALTVEDWA